MNLLFITNGIGSFDGSSKQLAVIVNGMAERGHNCYVYIFNSNQCGRSFHDGVTIVPEADPKKNKIIQWLVIPQRIRRIIQQHNIDIVIGWRTNGGCYAVLSTWGLHTKCVFSERADPYMENPGIVHKIVGKIASRADGGVFQTEKAKQFYTGLQQKAIVLPNPYTPMNDRGKSVPWKDRSNTIVYFGRLSIWQKRQDLLLKAFVIIHNKYPDYKLAIFGTGGDKAKLTELADTLGILDFVDFYEPVSDVLDKMRQARALLLTSDFEGIPNVVLDAFDAGLPVVSTDCSPGGIHVLVKDGENGFIVPFRDYRKLAQRTIELIGSPTLAEKFIHNGEKKLVDFHPQMILDKWDDYLNSVNNRDI